MRSYNQYCALAKALDIVGDRWTLLVVRELLIRGACRYTDLRNGLPGIATNLLADRLRELEEAGIVRREEAPPPVATALFHLTERGKELEPVLDQLGRWGAPLLAQCSPADAFCTHWLALPIRYHLKDNRPDLPPMTVEIRAGDEPLTVEATEGRLSVHPGRADRPDAVLTGPPQLILGVLTGKVPLAKARAAGLQFEGKAAVVARITAPKS